MYQKKIKKGKRYFEGWYFRFTDLSHKKSLAFIPGISIGSNNHAFIQVITHTGLTDYVRYDINDFYYRKNPLMIKVGTSVFSNRSVNIKLNGKMQIEGYIKFVNFSPIKFNLMGPFGILPNLPCYHQVISMRHYVKGSIKVDNSVLNNLELGYIETDKGHSFPKAHIWIQCHTSFASFSCAISEISINRITIPVCYALIYTPQKEYHFTSWLGTKLVSLDYVNNKLIARIKQFNYLLTITLLLPNNFLLNDSLLKSPEKGDMKSHVNEILTANINIDLQHNKKTILSDKGSMCAVEVENYDTLRLLFK